MSVRRRTWNNRDGSEGEAWVVNYTDRAGKRRLKTFDRKRDAESFEAGVWHRRPRRGACPRQPERSRSPRPASYGLQAARPPA